MHPVSPCQHTLLDFCSLFSPESGGTKLRPKTTNNNAVPLESEIESDIVEGADGVGCCVLEREGERKHKKDFHCEQNERKNWKGIGREKHSFLKVVNWKWVKSIIIIKNAKFYRGEMFFCECVQFLFSCKPNWLHARTDNGTLVIDQFFNIVWVCVCVCSCVFSFLFYWLFF